MAQILQKILPLALWQLTPCSEEHLLPPIRNHASDEWVVEDVDLVGLDRPGSTVAERLGCRLDLI